MKRTVIVLQTKNPRFPRAVFLVPDRETVLRFLENAFVYRGVEWHRVANLVEVGAHKQLASLVPPDVAWSEFFQTNYPYTMVPFEVFPSPRGYKTEGTDLKRMGSFQIQNRYGSDTGPTWEASPAALLLDKIEEMQVKLKGVLYDTPCEVCRNLFGHLAGQCKLLTLDEGRHTGRLCHMELFSRSDAIEETEAPKSTVALPVTLD